MRRMRLILTIFLFGLALSLAHAAGSPLLNRAAERWQAEGNHWAFTVLVREIDSDELKEERVERYDPSKPGPERWQLLSVDGQPPTEERRMSWQRSKSRKHRKAPRHCRIFLTLKTRRRRVPPAEP